MNIKASKDIIQQIEGNLDTPEIRVWVHPHEGGDDYYYTFNTFKEAQDYIKTNPDAEKHPLLAIHGYELNIYDLEE